MGISNIKDWCIQLNKTAPILKEYEDKLYNFYRTTGDTIESDNSMMTGCYKDKKSSSVIIKAIFSKFLINILFAVFIGLACWIVTILEHDGSFMNNVKTIGVSSIKSSAIAACIVLVIIIITRVAIKIGGFNNKIKNLEKLEEQLIPILKTVPPNYRNYDKVSTIAKVYFAKPTIDPEIILDVVDDYLSSNMTQIQSKFMSVMFDLDYVNSFLSNDFIVNNEEKTISTNDDKVNTTPKNEFLPSDIDSKVIAGSEDSDKDLAAMIGLSSVKEQIDRLKNRISFYGKNAVNNGNHMAFLGSAGTGKTTVARIVTKILFDLGYIQKNQYIEISGDYLCAGSTSRASAIIEYSYGGVLFIDEAYLMYRTGSEVIGVLLKAMEDHREDFVVILAGYEEQMTKLFASNEGFSSRVKHTIYFPDYTEEEMLDIFNYFLRNYNGKSYRIDNEAIPTLLDAFKLEKKAKSFGNARTVRNAVDMIMDFYADRSIAQKSDTHVIMNADVEAYFDNRKKALQHEIKNASAANQVDEQIIRLAELKPRVKPGSSNPDEALNNLVGLESFKTEIDTLKNEKEFYGKLTHQSILFIGEDGCGKTTLTEILTGYLYKLGYIQENKYLDIPAEFFKGSYVGHTAKRAEAIISYAAGGVLYIRNYVALVQSNDSFALDAINAIALALTKNEDVTIVIADNDCKEINDIENIFSIVYRFPKYNGEQLLRIFDTLARQDNFIVEESGRQKLLNYINSSNVTIRDIQQIYNTSVKNHISNFNGSEQDKYFISEADLVIPSKKIKFNLKSS